MLRRIFGGVNLSKTVSQINSLLDDLDKTKALLVTTEEETEVKDVEETPKNSTDTSSDDTKTDESKVRRRRSLEKRRGKTNTNHDTEKQGTRSDKGENS